ncbi:MAG: glycosyltransferase [Methylophilaceae bacterium]
MSRVMNDTPLISIIIPVFNGSDYLDLAIQSALAQTYSNIEVIVVNDGSADDGATKRISLSYGDRIRYFSKPNGGVASALNLAITEMHGAYLSWLSHDDLYQPQKLKSQMEFLLALPSGIRERTIVYSDYSIFTSDPDNSFPVRIRSVQPESFRYWITVGNALHGCTLLIPKTAFEECGVFDETLRTTQDYELWFRMAGKFRFQHRAEELVKARNHANQGTRRMADIALRECNQLLSGFVSKLTRPELLQSTNAAVSIAYAKIAASFWYRGFSTAAYAAMQLSLSSIERGRVVDALKTIGILAGGMFQYLVFASVRKCLSDGIRRSIKAFSGRGAE